MNHILNDSSFRIFHDCRGQKGWLFDPFFYFKILASNFLSEKEAIIGDKSAFNSVAGNKETTLFFIPLVSDISKYTQVRSDLFL